MSGSDLRRKAHEEKKLNRVFEHISDDIKGITSGMGPDELAGFMNVSYLTARKRIQDPGGMTLRDIVSVNRKRERTVMLTIKDKNGDRVQLFTFD